MNGRHWIVAPLLVLLLTACGGGGSGSSGYTVSGTLSSAAGTAIDSDTNDPFATTVGNDSPATAQEIPNPVLLGGFATKEATGQAGDVFATQPDEWDAFRTPLTGGQTVSLTIADHPGGNFATPDFDLYLATVADPETWVATSTGETRTETVTVPSDDEYYVVVHAFAGASNYLLNILPPATSSGAATSPPTEFVPGEILVRLEDTMLPLGMADPLAHFAAQAGLR
ncbi:MAG TPA: hypothetical protein ENN42_10000, partial [Thioalkalivibrio sp.]|nr:hypothetical protein [Thioalkalivibrio sp.]